jgi:hypothetical protein
MNKLASLVLLFVTTLAATAAPINDLSSPDQATRDAAAKILRATYQPSLRAKWELELAKVRLGMTRQALTDYLQSYHVPQSLHPSAASGGSSNELWRLDDAWSLEVAIEERTGNHILIPTDDGTNTILQFSLVSILRNVWVEPPKTYTGIWTTYYVNGQKQSDISYRNGEYFGTFVSYHADGSESGVQHYDETGCNGAEIDYFPSGRVSTHGQYQHNVQSGTWTWYNEDGSVKNTEDYSAHPMPR